MRTWFCIFGLLVSVVGFAHSDEPDLSRTALAEHFPVADFEAVLCPSIFQKISNGLDASQFRAQDTTNILSLLEGLLGLDCMTSRAIIMLNYIIYSGIYISSKNVLH